VSNDRADDLREILPTLYRALRKELRVRPTRDREFALRWLAALVRMVNGTRPSADLRRAFAAWESAVLKKQIRPLVLQEEVRDAYHGRGCAPMSLADALGAVAEQFGVPETTVRDYWYKAPPSYRKRPDTRSRGNVGKPTKNSDSKRR
jgi:hypothetical protein